MGRTLGFVHMARVFLEYLGGSPEEIQKGRLVALLRMLVNGPWSNVMDEYQTVRGAPALKLTKALLDSTPIGDVVEKHGFTRNEIQDTLEKGGTVKNDQFCMANNINR